MADDGTATGNCPPRGGCILFSTAPTPNLNVLHAPCCCPAADPARISTSRAHGHVSLPEPAAGSWNRSPLFRCFWWPSSLGPPTVPWMNEARCWPASASSSRIRWVLCWRASTLTPLRVGQHLHGLPLVVVAGSQPLLLHATRRIRLRFSKMQAATTSDDCCALCWRPLPRGFPASCSWFRLPQPLGRRVWRDQDTGQEPTGTVAAGQSVNHGHHGEQAVRPNVKCQITAGLSCLPGTSVLTPGPTLDHRIAQVAAKKL